MIDVQRLLALIGECDLEDKSAQKEGKSETAGDQIKEISKLTKSPTLSKKLKDLADAAGRY